MRMSDWSSDVCSSDLGVFRWGDADVGGELPGIGKARHAMAVLANEGGGGDVAHPEDAVQTLHHRRLGTHPLEVGVERIEFAARERTRGEALTGGGIGV